MLSLYISSLTKFASFNGCASRKEYWNFLFMSMVTLVITVFSEKYFLGEESITILGIVAVSLILPSISVTIRRLHDRKKSGWWFFIQFVPIVGQLILFIMCSLKGESETASS